MAKRNENGESVDMDALFCALVLVPNTYPRNRFFGLFESAEPRRVRRRAYHVRGVLRQLLGEGKHEAVVIGRAEMSDQRVLLRYRVEQLKLERSTALSALESAVLNYALHRAGRGEVSEADRERVEAALARLGPEPAAD